MMFIKHSEHTRLHKSNLLEETREKLSQANLGKQLSEETKKKLSLAKIGEKNPLFGKHRSEEIKKKISQAKLGKHLSKETRKKMSLARRGYHLYNNGVKTIRAKSCPQGFVAGRAKRH